MDAKEVLALVLKRVDVQGLIFEDLADGLVKPALDKIVAKSDNTLDDALLEIIWPMLKIELKKIVDEKLAELQVQAE